MRTVQDLIQAATQEALYQPKSFMQNNGIKTMADFMAQTESSFAGMKVKKGIPFTARFLKEQETIRRKLENL